MSASYEYDVVVRSGKGGTFAFIKELGLVGRGKDVSTAYRELERQKEEYLDAMKACGCEHEIPLPRRAQDCRDAKRALKLFALKVAIVGVLGAGAAALGGAMLVNKLATFSAGSLLRLQAQSIQTQIERFNQAPPDVKQRRVAEMREALRSLQPVLDEVRLILAEPSSKKR